ncbi:MAG: Ig-like domain repeat protein [Anaerolineae bacterium]|nr:Ig-like domain repeat protein [Anaerolineae bacterium]
MLKLNGEGAYRWHTFYGGSGDDHGGAIVLDGGGNIYVAGVSDATWNGPDGEAPLNAFSSIQHTSDIVVVKTSPKDRSTTIVTSSANPSSFGQSVTFTATVTSGVGTPTGMVTFKDGGVTLGTGSLNGSGVATYATSALAVGNHAITAEYSGDGNYLGSASDTLAQVVNKAGTTTTLQSSANPSTLGEEVTFTATVSGAGSTPTGSITFKDGGVTLGSGSLNGSGVATYSTSALAGGSHSITAEYGGDETYLGSSDTLEQTVNKAATTTTLQSSLNPSTFGEEITFAATVTSGVGTPTGSITFKDGGTTLDTVSLVGGVATYSTSALAVGNHSITAEYSGDGNYLASTGTLEQVVQMALWLPCVHVSHSAG